MVSLSKSFSRGSGEILRSKKLGGVERERETGEFRERPPGRSY